MKNGIHVGVTPKTVSEARRTINDILKNRRADQVTKIAALETLKTLCETNHTAITNCTVNMTTRKGSK